MARIQSLESAIRLLDLYCAIIPKVGFFKLEQDEHPAISLVSCGSILVNSSTSVLCLEGI